MIINCTPHVVDVYAADAPGTVDQGAMIVRPLYSLPPSGQVARIAERVLRDGAPHPMRVAEDVEVDVFEVEYTHVLDLPDAQVGVRYVVSLPTALAARRPDLLVPWRQVRNAKGTIVGCRGLARPV